MVATYTPNTHVILQGTGDNPGTWGAELNTNAFTVIDQVLGGVQTLSLSNIPVAVSTTQSQNNNIKLTGVLTGNVVVTFPAIGRNYFIQNNTTGAFSVTIACAGGGTTFVLPQGQASIIVLDGTNAVNALANAAITAGAISGVTLTNNTMILKQASYPSPTTQGELQYSSLFKYLRAGNGSTTDSYLPGPAPGALYGMGIANGTDATNDIDFAVGQCADSTNTFYLALASGLTKQLDAAWAVGTNQGGLFSGAIANTTYYPFIIMRPDTGVVDAGFDTSLTAANRPVAYTYYRRVGAAIRSGGAILGFAQNGNRFDLNSPVGINTVNPGTSAVLQAITVPSGIKVLAHINVGLLDSSPNSVRYMLVSNPATTNTAASFTAFTLAAWDGAANGDFNATAVDVYTDTSARVRYRLSFSDANVNVALISMGWSDTRGQG